MIDELALVSVVFAAVALISCLSLSDKRTIRRLPRFLWVIMIVLVPIAGPVAWFALGRPRTLRLSRPRRRLAAGQPAPAPDDDPEFLRSLKQRRPDDRPPDPGAGGRPETA